LKFTKNIEDLNTRTKVIYEEALRLGFTDCGITTADPPVDAGNYLIDWIKNGYHGEMKYMEERSELRCDPRKFASGARSVIMLLQNYYPSGGQKDPSAPVIARYAYGRDYHSVINNKLKKLLDFIRSEIGPCRAKTFIDTSPILEKSLAKHAGLGWPGKNTILISKKFGSFFFIGGIITDLELEINRIPTKDYCGTCRICIDACPTGALVRPYILDARKCISYLTIEKRTGGLPAELKPHFRNRIFGCDICQEVCPWNRRAIPHSEPYLNPVAGILEMSRDEWYSLDEKKFSTLFKDTSFERLKYNGLRRNLEFVK
jgi:epoxyqueuosine reductase